MKVVAYSPSAAIQFEKQPTAQGGSATINIEAATVARGKADWDNKWVVMMTDTDLFSFIGFSLGVGQEQFKITNRGAKSHFLTLARLNDSNVSASFTRKGEPARVVTFAAEEIGLIALIALSCLRASLQVSDASILELVRSLPDASREKT
jgi:hypothetical protein